MGRQPAFWNSGRAVLNTKVGQEPELHLLLELEEEVVRWRRRTLFLLSLVFHVILLFFVVLSPDIFRRGAQILGIAVEPKPREQMTLLVPPDLLKSLSHPPDTNILSDKNRRAQGPAPKINPKGLRMPYLRGNTPLPEIAGGGKPSPPPAPAPPPPARGEPAPAPPSNSVAQSNPPPPPPPKQEDNAQARLRLQDVQPPSGNHGDLALSTPGDSVQRSLEAAVRGRGQYSVSGPGDSASQFNNLNPNFSTEAPIILSDTRGFDFGPYLARILYTVKRNWYAVIPEAARLGEKGRVAIVFEIRKDGSVPELRLVGSSGIEPLDRAALAGIRASIPFPPLPEGFTGEHLVLQFNFLYNLGYLP
jgi:TonB family protein